VAIIIPTKGNVKILKDCIDSFYQHCNSKLFHIFIADTGSTNGEKDIIKNNIKQYKNITLIEYDYYNFAKINNDVVKNHVNEEYEFLLFCNNDVKLLNNVIYGMLNIFKTTPKVGTVGCRLHFDDNTIQHDGIMCLLDKNKNIQLTHYGIGCYYNFSVNHRKILGSTAALLMIKKDTFVKCNYFNENYISCFEDVELNLQCLLLDLDNYCNSNLVAYHYESQTRNQDPNTFQKLNQDYVNTLLPFITKHYDKIIKHIQIIN
jgi:GT2 family glycosyltransferase